AGVLGGGDDRPTAGEDEGERSQGLARRAAEQIRPRFHHRVSSGTPIIWRRRRRPPRANSRTSSRLKPRASTTTPPEPLPDAQSDWATEGRSSRRVSRTTSPSSGSEATLSRSSHTP